jgi:hypothetical protein
MKIDPNRGVLERWWDVEWARLKANVFCMFHWSCRIYIENTWVEDRNQKDLRGDPIFKEFIQYIAVIKGNIQKGDLKIVREYYGQLRTPLEAYNVSEDN